MGTRVLVVEDEQDIAGLIKHALERKGDIEVDIAGAGDAVIRSVSESAPDLSVLDLNLPVLSGIDVCRIVQRERPCHRHRTRLPGYRLNSSNDPNDPNDSNVPNVPNVPNVLHGINIPVTSAKFPPYSVGS